MLHHLFLAAIGQVLMLGVGGAFSIHPASGNMRVVAPVPLPVAPQPRPGPAKIDLDFAPTVTGLSYTIDLVVRDAAGKVLVSGPINIGMGADTTDIRDGIGGVLGDSGLEIVPVGNTGLTLASKGDTKLGAITYDTFVNGKPEKLAGPGVTRQAGTATLTVNGAKVQPPKPR